MPDRSCCTSCGERVSPHAAGCAVCRAGLDPARAILGVIQEYPSYMSPIPGEPLDQNRQELTTSDGRKVKLKIPGMPPAVKPEKTEQRAGDEPPRDDPRPPVNPNVAGL